MDDQNDQRLSRNSLFALSLILLISFVVKVQAFGKGLPNPNDDISISSESKKRIELNPSFLLDGSVDSDFSIASIESKRLENVTEAIRSKFPMGWSKTTAFSVLARGGLGDRFFLDVDYRKDERTADVDEDSKILLRYSGKKGELLKTLELGDMTLDLPGARWISLKGKTGKVSRQSFAAKSVWSYRELEMTLIGSHQKGKAEVEFFDLGNTVRRKEIRDDDYIRKSFYQMAPASDLPIDPKSLTIFYDDGNGFNNTSATQRFVPAGSVKEGFFDALIPHDRERGYELDPRTGVARFLFEVPFFGTLAVSYKTASGKEVEKKLIKADDDSISSELKNRYPLPQDFLDLDHLSVEDKSGRKTDVPSFSLDALRKLITFSSTHPFAAEAYLFPSSHAQTIILSYLSTGDQSTVMLSKEPYLESVKVELNGRPLAEGNDYSLHSAADRTALALFKAKPNDKVRVSYNAKDVPQVRQTVGGALVFGRDAPLTVTLSVLHDFAPGLTRVPQVGSDVSRVQMLGSSLKGKEQFGKTEVYLNLEAAGSRYDPNPFGASMIDNLDSARRALRVEMGEEFWKPSARPMEAVGFRRNGVINFEAIFLREIVPGNPTDQKEQMISFVADAGEWFGVHRALAPKKGAIDLRPYRAIEMFVLSNVKGGDLFVEWGDVSEDSNGNQRLETEDVNGDSLVDGSEDSGVQLENGTVYGKRNNIIETEDIDLDGRISAVESSIKESVELDWSGWKKLRFSLKGTSSARFLRCWVSGPANVAIAKVEFTGIEYIEEFSAGSNLIAGTVSSFSDPYAPSLINHPSFQRLYPQRNSGDGNPDAYERERAEDFALSLDYSVSPGSEVSAKRDVQMDLTDQREIHFFAASTGTTHAIFFLRLGNRKDYFEFTVAVPQLSPQYREFSIHRDRFRSVGNPDWRHIRELRIGLSNPSSLSQSGRIFFNELFLDHPIVTETIAISGETEISYPLKPIGYLPGKIFGKRGNLFLSGDFVSMPQGFRTPDEFFKEQNRFQVNGGWKSENAFLKYSKEEEFQKEVASGKGLPNPRNVFSSRLSQSFQKADRLDWDLKPRFVDWQLAFTGSFEKRERIQQYLRERLETFLNRFEYINDRAAEWVPKKMSLEGLYKKDLASARDTISGTVEGRWTVFKENLSLIPHVSFEETVQSSANFIVTRMSRVGISGTGIVNRGTLHWSGYAENKMRRSGFPYLTTAQSAKGEISYDGKGWGISSITASLLESKNFSSLNAVSEPSNVWKYQFSKPPFDTQSFNQKRSASAKQENIRIFNCFPFLQFDFLGVSVSAAIQQERVAFLGTSTEELAVKFPEGSVVFSSGSWHCSLGGALENFSGTNKRGRTELFPVQIECKKKRWELKNAFISKAEVQERSGGILLRLRTLTWRTEGKLSVGGPLVQTIPFMRRNLKLENRLELDLALEWEKKEGEENRNKIRELTRKLSHKTQYYIRESLKISLTMDAWQFKNLIASSNDYFAYKGAIGIHVTF